MSDVLWWIAVVLAAGWVAAVVNLDAPGLPTHLVLIAAVVVAAARRLVMARGVSRPTRGS